VWARLFGRRSVAGSSLAGAGDALPRDATLIRAAPGPPLGTEALRRRPSGRIAGGAGALASGARRRLAEALGPGGQLLWADENGAAAVADADLAGASAAAERDGAGGLTLVRDAIGERSLYYAPVGGGLLFCSTLRPLLDTGLLSRTLDPLAVAAYLTYGYVPGERTLLRDVRKLLPAEQLDFGPGGLRRSAFWTVPEEPATYDCEQALRARLREVLERSVRRRLPPAGERVGAFLSGGLDSSLVVALARRLHDGPISTFSVSFGGGYANELPYSSMVARHCGTDHRVVELSPAVIRRHLDDSIAWLSDPNGDPLTVPNALLFREAAAETGVVLNGEGGDPCFGGPKNIPMLLAELLGDGAERHYRERSYLRAHQKCFDDLPALLSDRFRPELLAEALVGEVADHFDQSRHSTFVTKLMALNVVLKGAHHILPKVDALSAPFGVLARSPLFDREVVETAFAIPPQLKLRGSVEKHLLKEAVRDILPSAILERPKSGMLVPVEGWFQGALLPEARERILDGLAPWEVFRRDYLERLLRRKLPGHRPRRGVKIWLLVTLESWLRTVVGKP
jgi:asparagine synthase (glutamine-hydrolysing)